MKYENQTFTDAVVTLDYNEFISCTFQRCQIVFHGGGFAISKPTMIDTRFLFADQAHTTLVLLNLLTQIDSNLTRALIEHVGQAAATIPQRPIA